MTATRSRFPWFCKTHYPMTPEQAADRVRVDVQNGLHRGYRQLLGMSQAEFCNLVDALLEQGAVKDCTTTLETHRAMNIALRNHWKILRRLEGRPTYFAPFVRK